MNEEEKKAMKFFYNLRATIDESNMLFAEDLNVKCGKETIKHITTVLNLIEKLQKENEELKTELERQKDINIIINQKGLEKNYEKALEKTMTKFLKNNIDKDVIPVQKVKDKIEEINKKILNAPKYDEKISVYRYQKQILQELIEESEEK